MGKSKSTKDRLVVTDVKTYVIDLTDDDLIDALIEVEDPSTYDRTVEFKGADE